MTTAPDLPGLAGALPAPTAPAPVAAVPPARTAPERPTLVLVPATEPIVDFDTALRAVTPRLVRYANRRLGDLHEAEEVVQEALLRAFQHRHTLATEDDLMAWLTVVTGRLVIDRLRVRGRTTPVADVPAGHRTGRDTADVVVARDEARIALDALEAMPTRQAAVLWAREVEGLSYDEIGARYDLSEPTVRSLLHRARRTLRREYAVRGGTLPSLGLVAFAPWLRGLRLAGRLRDIARKGAGAAAAAATGLAIATVAPLWSAPAPAQAQAAPPVQPYAAKAQTTRAAAPHVHHGVRAAAPTPATAVRAPAAPAVRESHTQIKALPKACTASGVGAGCGAPGAPTLFVQLPNHKDVGVSNTWLPVDCRSIPDTPLTHCQPNDRTN